MTVPMERVENRILTIRRHRVMLDADLAVLYGVTTGALNQAVKRNAERFPGDFMFRLTDEEGANLKSQIVISNGWGGRRRSLPLAFTEQGVSMLSGVLNSPRAVQVNIVIMRAFVRMREAMSSDRELAKRLDVLEKKYASHDVRIRGIFDAIRSLMKPPKTTRLRIGF
ncbi:MAG: ORF6N domain-containing protein [Desulfobacteria bacterium]